MPGVTERDAEQRIEISPEPEPEERDAILRAAARARETADGRSAWWREGVREGLEETPSRQEP
jgi:hypothetical protein